PKMRSPESPPRSPPPPPFRIQKLDSKPHVQTGFRNRSPPGTRCPPRRKRSTAFRLFPAIVCRTSPRRRSPRRANRLRRWPARESLQAQAQEDEAVFLFSFYQREKRSGRTCRRSPLEMETKKNRSPLIERNFQAQETGAGRGERLGIPPNF